MCDLASSSWEVLNTGSLITLCDSEAGSPSVSRSSHPLFIPVTYRALSEGLVTPFPLGQVASFRKGKRRGGLVHLPTSSQLSSLGRVGVCYMPLLRSSGLYTLPTAFNQNMPLFGGPVGVF